MGLSPTRLRIQDYPPKLVGEGEIPGATILFLKNYPMQRNGGAADGRVAEAAVE
jgi:hypothetical protein